MDAVRRLTLLLALVSAPATAALTPDQLAHAVARPPAGARLPASLPFTDQRGSATTLGAAAAGRPLVLVFADYTCRHICGPGLALTAGALHDSGLVAGRDYRLVVVGIDPKDGLAEARTMARQIGEPDVARATELLIGTPATIGAATRTLGYGYAYDADADAFAHDASVYVFAADGRLVTLLPEIGLRPATLRAALAGKAESSTSGLGEQIAQLCYGLAAAHGRYGRPVVLALQALALLMLAGMAAFLLKRRSAR